MDDHFSQHALQYGHLGTAFYLPDTQVWEFTRLCKKRPRFALLEGTSVTGLNTFRSSCDFLRHVPAASTKERAILKAYPELAPGLDLVHLHDKASQTITATVTDFDPSVSTRLALGKAVDEIRSSERSVAIVAIAHSDPPTSIALIPFEAQTEGLPAQLEQSIIPALNSETGAWWKCASGTVRQICSAEPIDDENVFFAARFSQITTIFYPVCQRLPLSSAFKVKGFTLETRSRSRININPLLDIPASLTGGHPHADVTFNPWYQRQLAIIDRCGNWSVWDIHGKQQRGVDWTADRGPCGSISHAIQTVDSDAIDPDNFDGWAAVSWIGSVHQIVVCDRRNLLVCRLGTQPPEQYPVDIEFHRGSDWIMDISRSKCNPSHLFVLTTTKLFWLEIPPDEISFNKDSIRTLLSWRHFRDIEDTSLRITQILAQNELLIVVYSRANNLAQVFQFSFSENSVIPASTFDPFILPIPLAPTTLSGVENGEDPRFLSMLFKEIETLSDFNEENGQRVAFVKFIGQCPNLEIVEGVYSASFEYDSPQAGFSRSFPIVVKKRRFDKITSLPYVDDFDFVVNDMDEMPIDQNTYIRGSSSKTHPPPQSQRIENWEHIYSKIVSDWNREFLQHNPGSSVLHGFDDWAIDAFQRLQDEKVDEPTPMIVQTLLERLSSSPSLDAIDSNAQSFKLFLQRIAGEGSNSLQQFRLWGLPLPVSHSSQLNTPIPTQLVETSLTALYDSLVFDWLSPLSDRVPNIVRAYKERIIRSIAADVTFSRLCLVPKGEVPKNIEPNEDDGPSMKVAGSLFPSSSTESLWNAAPSSSQDKLPNSNTSYESSDPYSFLRRYTTVNPQPTPTKHVLSTISHWTTGADPSKYRWTEAKSEESRSENLSGSQRRRKREERKRLQLQKREKQLSLPPLTPKMVEDTRLWGSQPVGTGGLSSSIEITIPSSQAREEEIPLTQTERGAFGSRDANRKFAIKERKKRRAAGF
ncbi:hypothetical protein LOZ57_000016 [Ophidiomyces ophidiicola]|uniref:uncharacterized protein n=1 Tax=Ophidiomyces ophidiicola TaxID=1387563 RepID=UPI0020C2DD79|nr:uncharacterized protein LOZ57_000016 [Ophidiomyces ophidiicola]KAI1953675.1 hypothetical protein LOZ57_000016 [Ophidiomyces ophidiicola]KAI2044382.1 hypothetical protein LOZ43_006385 [Ophidiomyces ophidiicola]